MRRAQGQFLSQPITTLENVIFFLAQPELKKLRIISKTNYLTVAYLLVNNVSRPTCTEYTHEMTARERLRSILVECISKLLLDQRIPKCIRCDFLSSNLKYKTWHEKNQKRKLKPRIYRPTRNFIPIRLFL